MVSKITPVLRPVMKAKTRSIHSDTAIPRPSDTGPVSTPGDYPDRILLLGNGALAGWGVRTHDDAIPGHLARELTSLTSHGTEVHLKMDHTVTIDTITRLTDTIDLTEFDAIVIVVGASDALQLLPLKKWDAAIQALLAELLRLTPTPTEIILFGIQPPSTVPVFALNEGGVVDQRADAFNTISSTHCTGRIHFLTPPTLPRIGPTSALAATGNAEEQRVSASYQVWARHIATELDALRPRNPSAQI